MSLDDLVVIHAGWIRRTARRYFSTPQDADDLAGETIYKCLANGRSYDHGRNFKPWALTIMANTYITLYNRRRCVLFTGIDGHEAYSNDADADQSVRVGSVLNVIRECDRKSCSIRCVMLYAEGYSYDEIGRMLHIPTGTVKSRVATGRKILREALR